MRSDPSPRESDASVGEAFEAVACRYPDNLAVKSAAHAWTYAALNGQANRVAHAVLAAIGTGPAPIALLMEHDAPAIGTLLGIAKAGRFYASLDASFPARHNRAVLEDLRPSLLICDRTNHGSALELARPHCPVLVYEAVDQAYPTDDPGVRSSADSPLAVFYTSGSTRQPKGVLRRHSAALQRIAADAEDLGTSSQSRYTLLTSLTFAASFADITRALMAGASLHLYDVRKFGTAYLADWLKQERITGLRPPIALFRHFLGSLREDELFPNMRAITLSGATLFRRDVETARRHFPAARLIHRYSLSEAGAVARFIIDAGTRLDTPVVPVGEPYPGKKVLILDEDRRELARGEVGEIAVRSRYLADGYLGRAEQTRERFVPDPADPGGTLCLTGDVGRLRSDGKLELLGRRDSRLKIRGFRVELAAVEAALRELESVQDAVVSAHDDASGETSMVAYVVSRPGKTPDTGSLRRALAAQLPEYMVPSSFVQLEALPLTRGGKLDRKALARHAQHVRTGTADTRAARSATEAALVAIWSEVLKLDHLGVEDDFFDLGGHSLLAARVIARVNERFQAALLLQEFYEAPTIAALAALIEGARAARADVDEAGNSPQDVQRTIGLLGLS